MNWLDGTGMTLAMLATLVALPYVIRRRWLFALGARDTARRHSNTRRNSNTRRSSNRHADATAPGAHAIDPRPRAWMTDPKMSEALIADGPRAMLERSPMRYDVAVYCGSIV
jgi:hypothetical protein